MKRLSYNPKVKVYINITSPNNPDFGKTIDISDDIIDGSVQLRLDGLSTATFKLQNKNGKYLGGYVSTNNETKRGYIFTPMDKIIIAAGRITDPFQIFTGYLDEVPAFQLYPDAVTIKASSTIKRLYNTYFDPGLPYLIQYFAEQGYAYDPQTGLLSDPLSRFGNWGVYGGIGELMKNTLRDIAGWPEDQITFAEFPDAFTEGIKQATGNLQDGQAYSAPGVGITGSPATVGQNQKATMIEIVKGLLSRKFKDGTSLQPEDAAAFVGNFYVESGGLNTGIEENTPAFNKGYGLAQWTGSRRRDLESFAHNKNKPSSDLDVQLDFVMHELEGGSMNVKNALKAETSTGKDSLRKRTAIVCKSYESPGEKSAKHPDYKTFEEHVDTRYPYTLTAYNSYMASPEADSVKKGDQPPIPLPNEIPNTKPDPSGQYKALLGQGVQSNGPIQPQTLAAADYVAQVSRQNLKITCGTNHDKYTTGGNISDHYAGFAVDIGAIGDELIRIGRAALIAFGADPIWANTENGGGYDIGEGFQVIFNVDLPASQGGDHTNHLHIGLSKGKAKDGFLPDIPGKARGLNWSKVGPYSYGSGKVPVSPIVGVSGYAGNNANITQSLNPETNTDFANGFVSQSLTSTDSTLSYLLTGDHALANDIPFIEWIKDLNTSSGRVFCSAPNGDFYSFFPDYFGWFNTTPYFYISDIETIDLNIQLSDQDLITHIYGIGPLIGYTQITPIDYASSPIASVQEEAFTSFIKTNTEITPGPTGSEIWRNALQDLAHLNSSGKWDSTAFLDRYGARPKMVQFSNIRNPALLWMATWMEFMKAWAKRYQSSASFTFMPELFPGGRVNIADRIEMFVESVTHNFSYSSGFSTSASLIAPTATGGVNLDGEAERTIRSASQVSNSSPDTGNGGN